jgi:hypothetical protein
MDIVYEEGAQPLIPEASDHRLTPDRYELMYHTTTHSGKDTAHFP